MKIFQIIFIILLVLSFAKHINAQSAVVQITVLSFAPAKIKVEGNTKQSRRVWSFRQSYAGVLGLGSRIKSLRLNTIDGSSSPVKVIAPGEFEAKGEATEFSYEVDLDPPANTSDSAYVSWLTAERGLFLLGDLLPLFLAEEKNTESLVVNFRSLSQWRVASVESEISSMTFEVANVARAVFVTGPDLRLKRKRIRNMEFDFVATGEWAFADEDALEIAEKILKEHIAVWGGVPRQRTMLLLSPFPSRFGAQRWSAETRGKTVILLSGKMPTKLSALVQLSAPLAHELFHFWLPNSLALNGRYDWFYEGFTLYQSLRAGMHLNYFTFRDYLDALERAYNAYRAEPERDALSLPDISRERWSGANALIYNKGLLIAFLYDLTLRQNSKGKRSLDDVFRELFNKHNSSRIKTDGNKTVIEILTGYDGMKEFVSHYIEKPTPVDLQDMLAPFGLILERDGNKIQIKVSPGLSRTQSILLKKFGYNEKQSQAFLNHQ